MKIEIRHLNDEGCDFYEPMWGNGGLYRELDGRVHLYWRAA